MDERRVLTVKCVLCGVRHHYLNLWYGSLDATTTEKDQLDFAALMDPDICHLLKISAVGLEVFKLHHTNMKQDLTPMYRLCWGLSCKSYQQSR